MYAGGEPQPAYVSLYHYFTRICYVCRWWTTTRICVLIPLFHPHLLCMQAVNHNPHMCPYTTISPAFAMYAGGEPRGKPFKRALHVIHSKCQRCCVVACMLTSSKVWCSKGKPFKRALHVIHGKCQRCCRSMSTCVCWRMLTYAYACMRQRMRGVCVGRMLS
jgi:hypothetical protein